MAHLTCWEFTELPVEIIDVVERDIKKYDNEVEDSNLTNNVLDKSIRNSHNSWIPESHWITGWLWSWSSDDFFYIFYNKYNCSNYFTMFGCHAIFYSTTCFFISKRKNFPL